MSESEFPIDKSTESLRLAQKEISIKIENLERNEERVLKIALQFAASIVVIIMSVLGLAGLFQFHNAELNSRQFSEFLQQNDAKFSLSLNDLKMKHIELVKNFEKTIDDYKGASAINGFSIAPQSGDGSALNAHGAITASQYSREKDVFSLRIFFNVSIDISGARTATFYGFKIAADTKLIETLSSFGLPDYDGLIDKLTSGYTEYLENEVKIVEGFPYVGQVFLDLMADDCADVLRARNILDNAGDIGSIFITPAFERISIQPQPKRLRINMIAAPPYHCTDPETRK